MRVELIKHWRGHKPGKVFSEMPDGAGNVLVRRGFAREASEAKEQKDRPRRVKRSCETQPIAT